MPLRQSVPERSSDSGAAVVDFVLVTLVLVPLVLGIVQLTLVLHVRNTLTNAAAEAARQAAVHGADSGDGTAYARDQIDDSIGGRFAQDIRTQETNIDGAAAVEVRIRAEVPPLGLWGPAVELSVVGHAIREEP